MGKICTKCGEDKELDDFRKRSDAKDGLHVTCRNCMRITDKLYRITHKLSIRTNIIKYFKSENGRIKINEINRKHRVNSVKRRMKSKIEVCNLTDSYVRAKLRRDGFIKNVNNTELIEIKRILLKTKRLCKTLQNSETV